MARRTPRLVQALTLGNECWILHSDVEFALAGHGVSWRRVSAECHDGYHRENDSCNDRW